MQYSIRSPRRGLTLLEVLAGTLILSAMMAAYWKVSRELRHQTVRADQTLKGVKELDQRIDGWMTESGGIPSHAEGPMSFDARFVWRTRTVDQGSQSDSTPWSVIRVEMVDTQSDDANAVVISIELLQPVRTDSEVVVP